MHFSVLGPPSVTVSGTTQTLETRVGQALAVLVYNAVFSPGPIRRDRLAELVWEEGVTAHPRRMAAQVLSKLRQVVGDRLAKDFTFVELIPDAQNDSIDLWMFDKALTRAQELRLRDPETAARLYEYGLGLWGGGDQARGLVGFPDTIAAGGMRSRLQDRYLDAVEECAEAQVATGQHRQVVRNLPELVKATPDREGLRALFLHALYLAGQPRKALADYEDYRTMLEEETGAAPGGRLTRVYDLIRAGGPSDLDIEPVQLESDRTVLRSGAAPTISDVVRMSNYQQGGDYNLPVDRAHVEVIKIVCPEVIDLSVEAEKWGARAARYGADAGLTQFWDLGAGPQMSRPYAVHDEVRLVPGVRVVYSNMDPAITAYSRERLADQHHVVLVTGRLSDPGSLLRHPDVQGHLDFTQPMMVLIREEHNYEEDGKRQIAELVEALPEGSLVALTTGIVDGMSQYTATMVATTVSTQPNRRRVMRSMQEAVELFGELEMVVGPDDIQVLLTNNPAKIGGYRALGGIGRVTGRTYTEEGTDAGL